MDGVNTCEILRTEAKIRTTGIDRSDWFEVEEGFTDRLANAVTTRLIYDVALLDYYACGDGQTPTQMIVENIPND